MVKCIINSHLLSRWSLNTALEMLGDRLEGSDEVDLSYESVDIGEEDDVTTALFRFSAAGTPAW
jgi:hypothetical protein